MLYSLIDSKVAIAIAVSVAIILALLIVLLTRKKTKKSPVDDLDFTTLVEALGKRENIVSSSYVQGRVKVVLRDLKCVDAQVLKQLNISVVLKGKELTMLIKERAKEFVSYLN